jgi:transglutaminase-like putative cysteine protease
LVVSKEKIRDIDSISSAAYYLKEAPYIESRDKDIVDRAKRIVKGRPTRADSLAALCDWVYRSVQKKSVGGLPSAASVFKNLKGDCNEHAVLFTALARAIGIPTKMQLGVVYQEGKFFYHAWNASLIGTKWVEIDPTFGLHTADAARIAMASGDMSSALQLTGMIGQIQIEIISTEQ